MKKKFIFIFFTFFIFFGCSPNKETAIKVKEPEKLVIWSYYETNEQKKALDELIRGFNNYQDEYIASWEYYGPVTEFTKKLSIGITQEQLPDMVIIDNPDMKKYILQDVFEDITDYVLQLENFDKYYKNVLSSVIYEDKYYGIPFCCNNTALIYNKDFFEEKNLEIPETWDDLLNITANKEYKYSFAISAISGEQSAFQALPFILSAGDTINSLGGSGTLKAFEFIKELLDTEALNPECINWSQNDLAKKFIDEECYLMQNGPWVLPLLDNADISYGIAPLPIDTKKVSVLGGENFAVIKDKNLGGAISFINYYNKDYIMLNTSLTSNSMPPRKDLAEKMKTIRPEYELFVKQIDISVPRGECESWPKITGILSEAQYKIVSGEVSPEEAVTWFNVN